MVTECVLKNPIKFLKYASVIMALTPAQIRYLNQCEPGEPVSHALSELLFNDHDLDLLPVD
ncbi:hypothetical protein D6909_16650 [Escherichia coli]|nr:hypothetical protein [Escherichia coli]